ncbi:MAG: dihydrolipoyllysine-residue succinyltransferase [Verrucomicrobia bacterium]|nr:dihydrolipoyllysine-residue succinyltransferase [Verrucomicrobiota bacterium]
MELFAPDHGTLSRITKPKGSKVAVGDVVGLPRTRRRPRRVHPRPARSRPVASTRSHARHSAPPQAKTDAPAESPASCLPRRGSLPRTVFPLPTPRLPDPADACSRKTPYARSRPHRPLPHRPHPRRSSPPPTPAVASSAGEGREEEVVPMSLIRRKIAERLLAAQNTMALLTTFNEVDMSAVIALRAQFQEQFQQRYQIKLGFMSFFAKAVIEGLKEVPALNAEIRDQSIVYRNYFDLGIAIGGGRGLVVPVLRNAERLSFAETERAIADFGKRARENQLKPDELAGGTFTITNGGVYGSLLSTPLINAPQSGVLGMHAIQERPVGRDGQVVLRPMMYIALTYDHRVVDGREAVTFLRRVKDLVEQPARLLLEV